MSGNRLFYNVELSMIRKRVCKAPLKHKAPQHSYLHRMEYNAIYKTVAAVVRSCNLQFVKERNIHYQVLVEII